jgi:predicted SAM-dependent methyltransferase
MLNVACGTVTHLQWNNIDFGPYALLARHSRVAALLHRCGLISELRWERLMRVDPTIVRWDIRNGIPYPTSTFDVVYHSHFLEHLRMRHATELIKECRRVLKPSGVLRVAVPDLAYLFRQYCESMHDPIVHGQAIEALIGQMVRDQATGPNEQKGAMKFIEKLIRGTTEKTGERHLWMYDAISLKKLLMDLGFVNCTVQSSATSIIPGWKEFRLDADDDGIPYKPESLYMEAVRPKQD